MTKAPVDAVFTWVDDRFPGYADQLAAYAGTRHDTNPNRTRDNLDLIRYALRSLEVNLPEVRRVYLVSCRPQVPRWLKADHPDIEVVHHDQIMSPALLPTFNSFSIVSHLHLLPGLAEQFIYVEDDMLFLRRGAFDAMWRDGVPLSHFTRKRVRQLEVLDKTKESPWNLALAETCVALARRGMSADRHHVIHGPRLIEKAVWARMIDTFGDEFAVTRASRFRSAGNIPPEFLYPHYAVEQGAAITATRGETRRFEGYVSLENFAPWTWAQLRMLDRKSPFTATLNDSFENNPNPRVERMVKAWLDARFPTPSRFERQPSAD
ncbi:stealth conserved region 3 domain-containing protein [Shimia biformata]|uniref:stealth conserved region 3 domain-containing protein n=1 Tax=Shimia biformata TaxID=1294299 RepID=UPI001951268C|nr:stealth conserved region 3 domain-containing protein [Shimia biformata]